MSNEKSDMYESGEFLANNPSYFTEDSPWKAQQIYRLLKNNNINVRTICEVGCGSGEVLHQLMKLLDSDIKYTGYDISPLLSEIWEQRTSESMEFFAKDFLLDEKSFDLACYIDVVEHIENYIDFLKKIKDRSEYKVFAFPLEISAAKAIFSKYYIHTHKKYGHIHFFNREIVEFIFEDVGLNIIDSFLAPTAIALGGKSASVTRSSRMLNIPRKLISKFSVDFAQRLLGGYAFYLLCK